MDTLSTEQDDLAVLKAQLHQLEGHNKILKLGKEIKTDASF